MQKDNSAANQIGPDATASSSSKGRRLPIIGGIGCVLLLGMGLLAGSAILYLSFAPDKTKETAGRSLVSIGVAAETPAIQ